MNFFTKKLKLLGHLIDEHGIAMDPHKVDSIEKWKVPTNRSLLMGFLGTAGYLAPSCKGIQTPMGVLTMLTNNKKVWHWEETHQRAFEDIKHTIVKYRNVSRTIADYSKGALSKSTNYGMYEQVD